MTMTLHQTLSCAQDQCVPITHQHYRGNQAADVKTKCDSPDRFPDEQAWIDGLQRGDSDCYERLVREHTGTLLGIARRYLAEQEAQDVVQEAFIKTFENIETFRVASSLSTWLHRIVINACISRLRRASARREIPMESLGTSSRQNGEPIGATIPRPEQFASVAQLRHIVRSCLASLPDTYRTVILLRDIEGFSGEETAQILCISANLVKVRLHRARRTLRDHLSTIFPQTKDADQSIHSL